LNSTGNSEIDQRRDSIFFLWTRNDEGWNWRKFADGVKDNGNGHVLVALGSADIPKGFKATLDGNPEDLRTSVEGFLDQIGAKGHRHFVRFGNHYASIATFGFQRDEKDTPVWFMISARWGFPAPSNPNRIKSAI
jgi:hypothetical protein